MERFKFVTERPPEGWALNYENVPGAITVGQENADLLKAAQDLGYQGAATPAVGAPPEHEAAERTREDKAGGEKSSKRKRVRSMVASARWCARGTPLDPTYRREVSLKIKKKRKSSSLAAGSSVSSDSSQGIGDEHQLKTIVKKLPMYLARRSAKEALEALSQTSGESIDAYQVFVRYYRQVVFCYQITCVCKKSGGRNPICSIFVVV